MSIQFKHEVKYNDVDGYLEVHENMLKINTSTENSDIYYKDIKFVFISQVNNKELIIGLDDNTNISLYLSDSENFNYSHMLNYINTAIIEYNSPKEGNDNLTETVSNEDGSKSHKKLNRLHINLPVSISINKDLLYKFHEESFIKQDIRDLKANLKKDGEFSVYDEYISLDTEYYELNLPYNVLADIEFKELFTRLYTLKLNDGSFIYITHKNSSTDELRKTYTFIHSQILDPSLYQQVILKEDNQSIQQQPPQQNMQPLMQQPYPQNNFQQAPAYQLPSSQKSKLIVVILHILFPGLGYAYMNRWGKFLITPIAMFITAVIRSFFMGTLDYMIRTDPYASGIWLAEDIVIGLGLLIIIIWVYALINSIGMVDKYNKGLPY